MMKPAISLKAGILCGLGKQDMTRLETTLGKNTTLDEEWSIDHSPPSHQDEVGADQFQRLNHRHNLAQAAGTTSSYASIQPLPHHRSPRPTMQIREACRDDIRSISDLIRQAHRDVAQRFGLTGANCPKHTSLCTDDWIAADLARGERYFLLENDHQGVACVAYERPTPDIAYLNRLSVLPAYRRRGIGEQLVRHIIDLARADGVSMVSIGIIGEHTQLQDWYSRLGFRLGETKRFPHLPFTVRYMAYPVARA